MRLEQLIGKLESAAKEYERKVWQSNSADLEALDLFEILSEAAKRLEKLSEVVVCNCDVLTAEVLSPSHAVLIKELQDAAANR
jgi:hypothetical protein